jgi:hypothetical protein
VVADPSEVVADPSEVVAVLAEVVADPLEEVADPSEVVADPSEVVAVLAEVVADPLEEVADPSEVVADPLEEVADPSEVVADPSEVVADPSEVVADPSQVVAVLAEEEVERPARANWTGLTILSDSVVAAQNERETVAKLLESTRQNFQCYIENYNTMMRTHDDSLAKSDDELTTKMENIVDKFESALEKHCVATGTIFRTEKYAVSWGLCNDIFTKGMEDLDDGRTSDNKFQERVCDLAAFRRNTFKYESGWATVLDAFELSWDKIDEQNKVDLDNIFETNGIDKGVIYTELVAADIAYIETWKSSLQTLREHWQVRNVNNRAENASEELLVVQEQETVEDNDDEPATQEMDLSRQRLHAEVAATNKRLLEGVADKIAKTNKTEATKNGLFDLPELDNSKQQYRNLNKLSKP